MPLVKNCKFPLSKNPDREAIRRFVNIVSGSNQGDEDVAMRNTTLIFEIAHKMGYSSIDMSNWSDEATGYVEFV